MLFLEALKMALAAITAHKLRSFLTMIGIIAGVASIIAVMTGISVIQTAIEKEISVLGTQTFQVQKQAAGGAISEEERRKISQRRPTTIAHANAIRDKVRSVDLVGPELWSFGHKARFRDRETNSNQTVCGGTPEYTTNNTHYVQLGRNLSQEDIKVGRNVVLLGYGVAQELFPWTDPLQKTIKIDGRKFRVVGVLEDKSSAVGAGFNQYLIIPITCFVKIHGLRFSNGEERSVNITVRAKTPELLQQAIDETRMVMRMERGLKPHQEDDFTIFTNDSNIKTFNDATAGVKTGSFVIGIVALIVAGIGIMNIMLVSVTERTREIGIRKALGAKRRNILLQFLLEAIILCNIGGIIGVAIGFGLGNIISLVIAFAAHVPLEWTLVGILFCTAVGLTFGFWPALRASKLDPIEALHHE
ncbi:MAG: ABC transporter permease [Candidatus Krumholzibacteriota bacterium]|nr:ABC transporter permease [Candidatus Krumholzibacteriota bacterium]